MKGSLNRSSIVKGLLIFIGALSSLTLKAQEAKKLSSFHPVFIGTFSSVSIIGKDTMLFNDTLTQIANAVYDSVIIARLKHITPVHTIEKLSEEQLRLLTTEITKNILEYRTDPTTHHLIPHRIMDSVAKLYDNRYSSYFVNFGNIWSKKEDRNYLAGRTLVITAVVVGFALLMVVVAAAGASSGNMGSGLFDDDSHEMNFRGMYCYYLIYDKELKQVCYRRRLRFNSDKTDNNPFNPARVEKQVESLFYLPH